MGAQFSTVIHSRALAALVALFLAVVQAVPAQYSQYANTANTVECDLYSVYVTIRTIIYVLALMLIILGAAVYAAANIMPQQARGGIQGYGMGMVIGGVSGVIIASLAPFILEVISNGSSASNIAVVAGMCPANLGLGSGGGFVGAAASNNAATRNSPTSNNGISSKTGTPISRSSTTSLLTVTSIPITTTTSVHTTSTTVTTTSVVTTSTVSTTIDYVMLYCSGKTSQYALCGSANVSRTDTTGTQSSGCC